MKTYIIAIILFLKAIIVQAQIINPVWQFAGPRSTNEPNVPTSDPNYNAFKTGQLDDIAVDPANPNHIIASSFFAGIWECTDYDASIQPPTATWHLLADFDNYLPIGMGDNWVSCVEFRNTNELYAASRNAVFKYEFSSATWSQLGLLPNASQLRVNQIVFLPNDPNHVFVCTNKGLVESIDAGLTWFQSPSGNPILGNIHGIVFVEKSVPGSYYWYVSGDNVTENALLMESADDGLTFTDITAYTSLYSSFISFAGICLGDQTAINGDRDIYISTAKSTTLDWSSNLRNLHKLTKNINNSSLTLTAIPNGTTGSEYYNVPSRLIIGYDGINNRVITGGVKPHAFNLTTNTVSGITNIHDDYHAIYINTNVSPNQIFLGCDGGFGSVFANGLNYTVYRLNYGMDICQINGFSGATESNIYVYGQQDHLISSLYDETEGRVVASHSASENDGGLIDKFNDNKLIIADQSSYGSAYYVNTNGAADFSSAVYTSMYPASSTPSYYFEPDANPYNIGQSFGVHPFFQHPFRQGRIYCTAVGGSIFQFDPISRKFVWKVRLDEGIQHFTCSPTLKSDPCSNCSLPCTTSTYLTLRYLNYFNQPASISFSQLDKNKVYVVTTNNSGACCLAASQVVRYIGSDFDDMWLNHRESQDVNNNPQWQIITPDFQSATFGSMSVNDIYHIRFTGVETSNWDKDKIYVSCASDLNPTIPFKVLIYDGILDVWSDYSTGIPSDENVTTMIMDHASDDGIYIATEKSVYYRQKGMPAWVSYNNGAPGTLMPFVDSRQMEINYRENTLRAGTYGRGIWKSNLVCPSTANLIIPTGTVSNYKEADDITTISGNTNSTVASLVGSTVFRGTNKVTLEPGFTADATFGNNYFAAFIHGCTGGSTSTFNYFRTAFDISEATFDEANNVRQNSGSIKIYPNPSSGEINIVLRDINSKEVQEIVIMNTMGQTVYNSSAVNSLSLTISVESLKAGIYSVLMKAKNKAITTKFIKN